MPDLFIDGQWCSSSTEDTRAIVNPASGAVIREVDEASPSDASRAVDSARAAFDDLRSSWRTSTISQRINYLKKIADLLEERKQSIAAIETADTGKTLSESEIDIDDVVSVFRYYASIACEVLADRHVDVGNDDVVSTVISEPVGVVTMIAPWNYPLLQISWKIAPAIAAGCTMILKPSEVTPLSTIELMKIIDDAGVPPGVVNLICGSGNSVGQALTDTPDVDFISFTGGLVTGSKISHIAAKHVTRVAVELGGKNPHIVFADAVQTPSSFANSVDQVLTGVFLHSGQVCSAGTRLIIEESIADEFVDALCERAEKIVIGPGDDPRTQTGPLVSQAHREKVEGYVALGLEEGAQLRCGGERPEGEQFAHGSYYKPTIFDHCTKNMRIVQEETFGPILTVERFTSEEQAVVLGNDTDYGLAAGVRSSDDQKADRVARALRHGTVWINDFGYYTPAAEWGGYGASGNGRELGPTGLQEYVELKHVWKNSAAPAAGWFTVES